MTEKNLGAQLRKKTNQFLQDKEQKELELAITLAPDQFQAYFEQQQKLANSILRELPTKLTVAADNGEFSVSVYIPRNIKRTVDAIVLKHFDCPAHMCEFYGMCNNRRFSREDDDQWRGEWDWPLALQIVSQWAKKQGLATQFYAGDNYYLDISWFTQPNSQTESAPRPTQNWPPKLKSKCSAH